MINLKDLRKLQNILKEYNGKDLYIRFNGSLRTYIHIYNAQCLITKIVLLIGNVEFQLKLAMDIGITQESISKYENDTAFPSKEVLIKLANA